MAITSVKHGDLVLVHDNARNVHGLFTCDTAAGDDARVRPPDGGPASLVRLADICAVYSATALMS